MSLFHKSLFHHLLMGLIFLATISVVTFPAFGESLKRSKHGAWTVYSDFQSDKNFPNCSMLQQKPAVMMGQFVFFDFNTVFLNMSRPSFDFEPGRFVQGRINLNGRTIPLSGTGAGLNANFELPPDAMVAIRDAMRTGVSFSVSIDGTITEVSSDGWEAALFAVQTCLSEGFSARLRGGAKPGTLVTPLTQQDTQSIYRLWAYHDGETANPIGCSLTWRGPDDSLLEFLFTGIDEAPAVMLVRHPSWQYREQQIVSLSYSVGGDQYLSEGSTRFDAVVISIPADRREKMRQAMIEMRPIQINLGDDAVDIVTAEGRQASDDVFACQIRIGGE